MAASLPNICAYIEATRSDPFLLENVNLLVEDFMARLKTECCGQFSEASTTKTEDGQTETGETGFVAHKILPTLFEVLIKSARTAARDTTASTEQNTKSDQESKLTKDPSPIAEAGCPTEDTRTEDTPVEIIIPIQTSCSVSSEYEIKFDFAGCTANSIKLETEEGLLKATGRKEEEDGAKIISYERKLPADVDSSSMKAYFLADGTLRIVGKRSQITKASDV